MEEEGVVKKRGMRGAKMDGESREVKERIFFFFLLTLNAVEKKRVQNKQKTVDKPAERATGAKSKKLCSISSPFGEENYRLLVTVCLAGHKWTDLEMVGSMFRGCGDQGELIRW